MGNHGNPGLLQTAPTRAELRSIAAGWLADPATKELFIRSATWNLGPSASKADVKGVLETFFRAHLDTVIDKYSPVFAAASGLSHAESFKRFALTALRNLCRTQYWLLTGHQPSDRFVPEADAPSGALAVQADQLEYMSAEEDRAFLGRALKELNPRHRLAFELIAVDGLSPQHAADRMGTSVSRATLWKYLGKQELVTLSRWKESAIVVTDIKSIWRLCKDISDCRTEAPSARSVGGRLWMELPEDVRPIVERGVGRSALTLDEKSVLLKSLNGILTGPTLYVTDMKLPQGIYRNNEFASLIKRPKRGPIARLRLHRLLFDAAFPNSIHPVHSREQS